MSLAALLLQLLNGLVDASGMFLVAAGLSLIFGVTRIVNFAHGSMYMLGMYLGYAIERRLGTSAVDFWGGLVLAALAVGLLGAAIEMTILRRIYRAPELFQLLATFALVLIIQDATLAAFGPDDLFTPRVPHLGGAIALFGRRMPTYDLVLLAAGPLVWAALWLLLYRSRFGMLLRAATEDRQMVGALGVNQAWLFTGVFALGTALAGLAGGLEGPRMPADLSLDLETMSTAFVVVVVGGMGSVFGAFAAALIIGEAKALCIALGDVQVFGVVLALPRLTLVAEFLVMALVLVVRPYGLFGKAAPVGRVDTLALRPWLPLGGTARAVLAGLAVVLLALPALGHVLPYLSVLVVEILIAALFAASLHFLIGPAGMHSFGHAAYFGLGAYGAALLLKSAHFPMELALCLAPLVAGLGGVVFGWFCVRLSGIYLAMLTLAFAQIIWSVVYQWDGLTGGSNGLVGVWPAPWLAGTTAYYYLTLASVAAALWVLRRILFAPFGYALRAARDSPLRAAAIGLDVRHVQWVGFIIASLLAGLGGALYAFSKGSISPDILYVNRSVDGLVMVLLGGVESLFGPWVGAGVFTWLSDTVARETNYWRAWLGAAILLLVLLFPGGIVGVAGRFRPRRAARSSGLADASGATPAVPAHGVATGAAPGAVAAAEDRAP